MAKLVAIAFVAAVVIGCDNGTTKSSVPLSIVAALNNADEFELLSLDPVERQTESPDDFHKWAVLGRTRIQDISRRRALVAALQNGAAENTGVVAACFNPRHGIRAIHDGKATDLVICFECFQVWAYSGDVREFNFPTTRSPQSVFDQALQSAGVPLASPAAAGKNRN